MLTDLPLCNSRISHRLQRKWQFIWNLLILWNILEHISKSFDMILWLLSGVVDRNRFTVSNPINRAACWISRIFDIKSRLLTLSDTYVNYSYSGSMINFWSCLFLISPVIVELKNVFTRSVRLRTIFHTSCSKEYGS